MPRAPKIKDEMKEDKDPEYLIPEEIPLDEEKLSGQIDKELYTIPLLMDAKRELGIALNKYSKKMKKKSEIDPENDAITIKFENSIKLQNIMNKDSLLTIKEDLDNFLKNPEVEKFAKSRFILFSFKDSDSIAIHEKIFKFITLCNFEIKRIHDEADKAPPANQVTL